MTQKQKLADYDRVARERDAFMLALNDALNQDIAWSGWHRESGSQGKYRVGMSRLDAADGGLMVVTYRHPGQTDYTTVQSRDAMESIGYINEALMDAMRDASNSWHDSHVSAIASARVA